MSSDDQIQVSQYSVQRAKVGSDIPFGKIHFSDDGIHTLCGKFLDEYWWILTNNHQGEATCTQCVNITNNCVP